MAEFKKEEEGAIKKHNDSIQLLASDISKAINAYLKRGYVNFATIIGILEDMKINLIESSRRLQPCERVKLRVKPPEYIG